MNSLFNRYITKIIIYKNYSVNNLLTININGTIFTLDKYEDQKDISIYSLNCYILNRNNPIYIEKKYIYDMYFDITNNVKKARQNNIYNINDTEETYTIYTNTLFLEKKYYKTWLINYFNLVDDVLNIIKYSLVKMII